MTAWLALAGVALIFIYLVWDRVTGKAWAEDYLRALLRKERAPAAAPAGDEPADVLYQVVPSEPTVDELHAAAVRLGLRRPAPERPRPPVIPPPPRPRVTPPREEQRRL